MVANGCKVLRPKLSLNFEIPYYNPTKSMIARATNGNQDKIMHVEIYVQPLHIEIYRSLLHRGLGATIEFLHHPFQMPTFHQWLPC